MRSVSVFGATGLIGENTFDLQMRDGGPDIYRTVALTGARNIARLAKMARALRAEVAVTATLDHLSRGNSLGNAASTLEEVQVMDHLARKTAVEAVATRQQSR